MGETPNDLIYSIKRVKDIYFYINEKLYISDPSKIIKIELGQQLGFNLELGIVNFTLRIFYHYEETPQNILVDINVENIFEVKDLKRFQLENNLFVLPQALIISIVSMSISHGRALLLKNTAGTTFQDAVMPITNAIEVTKHFFPYMFEEEASLIQTDMVGNILHTGMVNQKETTPNE